MRGNTLLLIAAIAIFLLAFKGNDTSYLHIERVHHTAVSEPSDIVTDPLNSTFYIVSDNGILMHCDKNGAILETARQLGIDFEGIELHNDTIYVCDETGRSVYRYRKQDLTFCGKVQVPYTGARNSGYESICWNEAKGCFIMVTEKNPVTIQEFDPQFHPTVQYTFHAAHDISGARFFDGRMYLLSDEDRTIFSVDPLTYEVVYNYHINIWNPEGITFMNDGSVVISADDLQRIYWLQEKTDR